MEDIEMTFSLAKILDLDAAVGVSITRCRVLNSQTGIRRTVPGRNTAKMSTSPGCR
ncbi:hypothetical protein [Phosphitispora fastidiosa]|uniref:hypothetical protein n=1 Tax=Phosphitispora fastidiosa TaxID=2837202 RepID=UPI001E64C2E5|nr:hypothetical protein [Phosphitispora fastidiosa]MBU7005731.1 hypothetical protein [Phosphitispora fastidiosa]